MTDRIDLIATLGEDSPPGVKGDLLVVDDQSFAFHDWTQRLTDKMLDLRVLTAPSVDALSKLLRDPPPDFRPVAALIDLDLGPNEPSGLEAIRELREHPSTRAIALALNTAALDSPHRELLAVLSAEVAGTPLVMATKQNDDVKRLKTFLIYMTTSAPESWPQYVSGGTHGLQVVHPVTVRRVNGTERPLLDLLAGRAWKELFWKELIRTKKVPDAHQAAIAAFPNRPRSSEGVVDDLQANSREFLRNDLGLLPLALEQRGGSFLGLEGVLDLAHFVETAEVEDVLGDGRIKAQMVYAFATLYRPALENPDLYVDSTR
jgi:CheY-like chemotaxis protein